MSWEVREGDCLDELRGIPAHSIDAIVTDPPSGTSFLQRAWDTDRGGRDAWVAWLTEIARELARVLKPGGSALVWALPRTSHWTATAFEDAGFAIRDVVTHHYAVGFPKSRNLGEGRGTALKPASEHWILCRAPLSEKSIEKNVGRWGTGGLQIDACRIGRDPDDVPGWHETGADGSAGYCGGFKIHKMSPEEIRARCGGKGRWPANLCLSHAEACRPIGSRKVASPAEVTQGGKAGGGYEPGSGDGTRHDRFDGYGDANGEEEVTLWECVPGCPVGEFDRQGGVRETHGRKAGIRTGLGYGSTSTGDGGEAIAVERGCASRFFFCTKPSRAEKELGCDDLPTRTLNRVNKGGMEHDPRWAPVQRKNTHPTPKPVKLMKWLIRLITPPGGIVLDPFCGSGTTGVAAVEEGFSFLGIDNNAEPGSTDISRARISHAAAHVQPSLFEEV